MQAAVWVGVVVEVWLRWLRCTLHCFYVVSPQRDPQHFHKHPLNTSTSPHFNKHPLNTSTSPQHLHNHPLNTTTESAAGPATAWEQWAEEDIEADEDHELDKKLQVSEQLMELTSKLLTGSFARKQAAAGRKCGIEV